MDNFQPSEEQIYQNAKKQAREIRSFYFNLLCYCCIIPLLIVINLVFVPEFHWFWFPIMGWGTGLFFHAMAAFNFVPFFGKEWEQKKIKEFMEKEQQRQRQNN